MYTSFTVVVFSVLLASTELSTFSTAVNKKISFKEKFDPAHNDYRITAGLESFYGRLDLEEFFLIQSKTGAQ